MKTMKTKSGMLELINCPKKIIYSFLYFLSIKKCV